MFGTSKTNVNLDGIVGLITGDKQAKYQARIRKENAMVRLLPDVSWAMLREFVGERIFEQIDPCGITDPDDVVDSEFLRMRYSTQGGLVRFISEAFPGSTSKSPLGPYQTKSIEICEEIIRHGGVQQALAPRGFGKTSSINRSALWALLFGFRHCAVCFQSNQRKSRQTIDRLKAELIGNIVIRAMFPELCSALEHAKRNAALQGKQHYEGQLTNVHVVVDSIRLPDINQEDGTPEPFSGGRIFSMPFGKAAGLSIIDPVTLQDVRPDILLADDVQSHDDALKGASAGTQTLLDIWNESLRYLAGRGKTLATFFSQTIVRPDDFASRIEEDPSIQTYRYGFVVKFPTNHNWWMTKYRDTFTNFDPADPKGQQKAREDATKLYLDNRAMADEGAEVAWENAYDPSQCASALQQAYNNLIVNPAAFWSQDQNNPMGEETKEVDIRCKPGDIVTKQHESARGIIPDFATRLVAHIDVHDDLLYFVVCAGDANQSLAIIDYQTWPKQDSRYFKKDGAVNKFQNTPGLMELHTTDDMVRRAIHTLLNYLVNECKYLKADGTQMLFDAIGVDCGDNNDNVHAAVRDSSSSILIPTRGVSLKPGDTKLNERMKKPNEKRRGDCWIEKRSDRTKQNWIEFDSSYYKYRIHKGLCTPAGTAHAVTLFQAATSIHRMLAEHCNSERPKYIKADAKAQASWVWTKLPGDNHFFDCLSNCSMLLNRSGAHFHDVAQFKSRPKREKIDTAEAWGQHFYQ